MASVSLSRDSWDPYTVLNVNPNNPVCTCVGIAKSTGSRCRWRFNSEQFNDYQKANAVEILKSMSKKHPSQVTQEALYLLAQNTLCMEFHQRQAGAKSAEWKANIDHLRGPSEGLPVRQLQYEPNHANQLQNGIAKDQDASEQEIKKTLEMLEKVTAELEESQTLCSELTEKNKELDKQWEEDQAANSWDSARLRQQLTESRSNAKALDEQKTTEVENLKKQLEGRNANFEKELKRLRDSKTRLEKAATASILEISSLKAKVRDRDEMLDERARTSEREANSLRQRLVVSSGEVGVLKAEKASSDEKAKLSEREVESVRQQLAASSREVAVLKKEQVSSDEKAKLSEKEAGSVRQELQESNARREALEVRSPQDSKRLGKKIETLSQKYTESKNENAAQISRLREQDQKIERIKEQMDGVKRDLAGRDRHVEDLVKQMDVVKEELAEREDQLSSLLPRDVKKGLFAVISRQPPRVLVRKISKIMRTESAPYVQSAA